MRFRKGALLGHYLFEFEPMGQNVLPRIRRRAAVANSEAVSAAFVNMQIYRDAGLAQGQKISYRRFAPISVVERLHDECGRYPLVDFYFRRQCEVSIVIRGYLVFLIPHHFWNVGSSR